MSQNTKVLDDLSATLALLILDRPDIAIVQVDMGFGEQGFVHATDAVRDGPVTRGGMFGGSWTKVRRNGEVCEIYGRPVPNFSRRIELMHEAETEIERLGCAVLYVDMLTLVIGKECGLFELVHATAEQRCRAAIGALRAHKAAEDELRALAGLKEPTP